VYGQGGEVVGLSEALFVALFAVGDGILGSILLRRYNVNLNPNPNSVFCSNPNKVSLVVHIAVSVFHFQFTLFFQGLLCVYSVFHEKLLCEFTKTHDYNIVELRKYIYCRYTTVYVQRRMRVLNGSDIAGAQFLSCQH
jgi:hypothetical protein